MLKQEPDNAKALRGLGFCRIRQADYQGAVESYRAAAQAEPGNADGWAGLGSAWLGLQNLERSRSRLRKSARHRSEQRHAHQGNRIVEPGASRRKGKSVAMKNLC